MPRGIYDRATSEWRPRFATDPPELVEAVRAIYASGLTMREVAAVVGVTTKVLQRLMPRHGIKRRTAAKRDQTGPRNSGWKGSSAGYGACHDRVRRARGAPHACSSCGAERQWIDWANLTGRYDDVNDYAAMCRSCHRAYDASRR